MTDDLPKQLRRENDILLTTGLDLSGVLLGAADEIERLRKALEPIARFEYKPNAWVDCEDVLFNFRIHARAALAKVKS